MRSLLLLLLLCLCPIASAQLKVVTLDEAKLLAAVKASEPPVKVGCVRVILPDELTAKASWETDPLPDLGTDDTGKAVIVYGELGLTEVSTPFAMFDSIKDGKPVFTEVKIGSLLVWGIKPGKVKLTARVVSEGVAKRVATKVIEIVPDAPPKPPTPPVPPVPSDLQKRISAAFMIDGGPSLENKKHAASLASTYRMVSPTVKDAATGGQVVAMIGVIGKSNGLSLTTIPATVKVVADDMQAILKDVTFPLTPETRAKTEALLGGAATALESLVK